MIDSSSLRLAMVNSQVRPNDVTDLRLLEAMLAIPRELFVPVKQASLAYLDRIIRVSNGLQSRFLLPPMVVAKLIQALEIGQTDKVLVIGSATGYSAAILARLAAHVIAVEEDAGLAAQASKACATLGLGHVECINAPLTAGHTAEAPYDAIFIEGAVEIIPQTLIAQLKEKGRLAAVQGVGGAAAGMIFLKIGENLSGRPLMNATAPLLPGFAKEPTFVF